MCPSANIHVDSYFISSQKGASAQTFFAYIVESILPKLNELAASDGEDVKLEMLKLCAEMSPHGLTDENVKAAMEPIYNLLLVRFMLVNLSTCYAIFTMYFQDANCHMFVMSICIKSLHVFLKIALG